MWIAMCVFFGVADSRSITPIFPESVVGSSGSDGWILPALVLLLFVGCVDTCRTILCCFRVRCSLPLHLIVILMPIVFVTAAIGCCAV